MRPVSLQKDDLNNVYQAAGSEEREAAERHPNAANQEAVGSQQVHEAAQFYQTFTNHFIMTKLSDY